MRSMLTNIRNRHFSERLFYADSLPQYAYACYNGNVSVMNVKNEAGTHTFYNWYDSQNRLTGSCVNPYNPNIDIEEQFTYDEVGNIVLLRRHNGFHYIDLLNYNYGQDGGNQVLSIADSGTDVDQYNTIEYHNGDVQADTTMFYDKNGNLISDADRRITTIHYNILNLPDTIQFADGHQIVNMYDAAGQKYRSIIYTNIASAHSQQYDFANYSFETDSLYYRVTEYSGNIETYTTKDTATTARRRIFNSIGYNIDNTYYHYIKDHIGNICAVVNSMQDTAVQSTLYYPSGVPLARSFGRDVQPYLYNGKEFIEAHGLNEYDSHARWYYPAICRTTTMDPLCEKYYNISPYAWCGNNFVNVMDLNGDSIYIMNKNCQLLYQDGKLYNTDYTPFKEKLNRFTSSVLQALKQLASTEEGALVIQELQSSKNIFNIKKGHNHFAPLNVRASFANLSEIQAVSGVAMLKDGSGGDIFWNPRSMHGGIDVNGNTYRPAYIGLGHELMHARDANKGLLYYNHDYTNPVTGKMYHSEYQGVLKSEWRAVYQENIIRLQAGLPLRTHYGYTFNNGKVFGNGPLLLSPSGQPLNYP